MIKNAISILGELCQKNKLTMPTYEYTQCSNGQFEYSVKLYDEVAYGVGQNKSIAKHNAADNMLKCNNLNKYIVPNNNLLIQNEPIALPARKDDKQDAHIFKSSISLLSEYCQKYKLQLPTYNWKQEVDGTFVCSVIVYISGANDFVKDTGTGRNKSEAKHNAATNIVKQIGQKKSLNNIMLPNSLSMSAPMEFTKALDITIIDKTKNTHIHKKETDIKLQKNIAQHNFGNNKYNYSKLDEELSEQFTLAMPTVLPKTKDHTLHKTANITKSTKSLDQINNENYISDKKIHCMYQKLSNIKTYKLCDVRLVDRHNYFLQYSTNLKKAAIEIINSKQYSSIKNQALDVLQALGISFKKFNIYDQNLKPLVVIELQCDYDVIFAQTEDQIYTDILYYFKEMLQ